MKNISAQDHSGFPALQAQENPFMLVVITSPEPLKNEGQLCNRLFENGLQLLHLRKPGADKAVYERFLQKIDSRYYDRIVIHDHYELACVYPLRGIHLKYRDAGQYSRYKNIPHISVSCHSFEEIENLPFAPEYCFLSPVFDSISKQGYKSKFTAEALNEKLPALPYKVLALGGITAGNIDLCRKYRFAGVAVLGCIWKNSDEALQRFVQLKTPTVLSVAGFDPTSGAGITADIKTFESCGAYGLGICSALTFQNQDEYTGTNWTGLEDIEKQADILFRKFSPQYLKIGLIENFGTLSRLASYLANQLPGVRIIWDPVLKASAGFTFHQETGQLEEILKQTYLITPNTNELKQLFGEDVSLSKLQHICRKYAVNILWKGGHNEELLSNDRLITAEKIDTFSVRRNKYEKHGTGCVLSAVITAFLAQGYVLSESCRKAQLYVSAFMDSNNSKLGYHFIKAVPAENKPRPTDLSLQYITDPKDGTSISEQIEAVCKGGMKWIQLRMKDATDEELLLEGQKAKEICKRYGALFIINDNIQVAMQLDADGIHLGKEDMNPLEARAILGSKKIIGATCNTYEDLIQRAGEPVDYVGLGPFTFTTTKKKLSPVLGLDGYRELLEKARENGFHIPVFAIGGITEADIPGLMKTGIQGIALSSLIKNSNDLTGKTTAILQILRKQCDN